MAFPDTAFLGFLYWLINTQGLGGIAVVLLGISIVGSVSLVLRWVVRQDEADAESYAYPTPALHHLEQD